MSKTQNKTAGQKSFELTVKHLKREAKRLAKETSIPHSQALDAIAQKNGYRNWSLLAKSGGSLRIKSSVTPPELAQPVDLKPEVEPTIEELLMQLVKNYETDETDTPNPSQNLSKKKFLTLTKIGKEFAMSAAKVKSALLAGGFLDETKSPTKKSLELGACKLVKAENKFSGPEMVSFYVWDIDCIRHCFNEPSELSKFLHVENRYKADRKLDQVFCRAGRALGLLTLYDGENYHDLGYEAISKLSARDKLKASKMGISEETYRLLVSSLQLHGPHPGDFMFVETNDELQKARRYKDKSISELYGALQRKRSLKVEADFFISAIDGLFNWMSRQVR